MKEKLPGILLATFVVLLGVLFASGLWYYTLGRKPKLIVSTQIAAKGGVPTSHMIPPGEVLLVVGANATLYDTVAGKEKWSSHTGPAQPAPAAAAVTPPVSLQTPALPVKTGTRSAEATSSATQQMLEARVNRRSAKLEKWAAELASKRDKLNTPLKVAEFKKEQAKYDAELAEARAEMATLNKGAAPATGYAITAPTSQPNALEPPMESSFERGQKEVFSDGSAIWVVEGRKARMFDHANGRLIKEISLAGDFKRVMHGAGCWYVVTVGESGAQQVTRFTAADGAAKAIDVNGAIAQPRFQWAGTGEPPTPTVQSQRTEFSAAGAELLQMDVRLVDKKITERQALKGDSASDWEAADKNTTGGWSNDAAVLARAMANDVQRETTGGKERIDESTYEVLLRRPFNSGIADGSAVKVQGRPELFSTPSFDLVVAGRTLIAFDHSNKKLWEAKLAFPAAEPPFMVESASSTAGSMSQPCLEDDKRLYFFDRGFLNAFDRNTGAIVWRLSSVGISKIQLDAGGILDRSPVLYVTSGNISEETLEYSQQSAAPRLPLLFKVDAGSGKILWKVEKYQDCFVSQGNVYATLETRNAEDLVNSVFQSSKAIQTRFKLYKLSARNGQPQWEWFQTRRPLRIEADKKKVSLLFPDELQVLTSRAL
jgi:outer membrane protein assembly factor BamB